MQRLPKLISIFAVTGALLLAQNGNVSATLMFNPCQGSDCVVIDNIITGNPFFPGNDDDATISAIVGMEVMQVGKVDHPATSNGGFSVTYPDNFMGEWDSGTKVVDYVVAKGGPQFAVYDYVSFGPATSGDWSTIGLEVGGNGNQAAISHVSFYMKPGENGPPGNGGGGNGTAPIPEPGTLLLLGSGLVGLGVRARKQRNTKRESS